MIAIVYWEIECWYGDFSYIGYEVRTIDYNNFPNNRLNTTSECMVNNCDEATRAWHDMLVPACHI